MTHSLNIQLPEKVSTNVYYRMHAMKRHPVTQAFYLAVLAAVRQEKVKPVAAYPVVMEYLFRVPGRQLDNLNLGAMAKMVEDGLRHANVLKDDTPAEVAGVYLLQERSRDKSVSVLVSWGPLE